MKTAHTNPTSGRSPRPGASGARRTSAGMTLVEMLVAVSVLAVMILSISQILVQTQRFISVAQKSRRSHAMAFTIARIIRRDFGRVSKDGFLYISPNGDRIIFSTAGPASGINDSVRGDGSIIAYGGKSCTSSTDTTKTQTYLWRPEFVCNFDPQYGLGTIPSGSERINVNFSSIVRAGPSPDANSSIGINNIVSAVEGSAPPQSMQLPPPNASNLRQLWQVLLPAVDDVKIYWTDGGRSGDIPWNSTGQTWTHKDQTAWPTAVRITFSINDPTMPRELRAEAGGYKYEVICAVGQ